MKNDELITLPLKKYEKIKEAAEKGFKRMFFVRKIVSLPERGNLFTQIVPQQIVDICFETFSESDLFKKLEDENKHMAKLYLSMTDDLFEKDKEISKLRRLPAKFERLTVKEFRKLKNMSVDQYKKWRDA